MRAVGACSRYRFITRRMSGETHRNWLWVSWANGISPSARLGSDCGAPGTHCKENPNVRDHASRPGTLAGRTHSLRLARSRFAFCGGECLLALRPDEGQRFLAARGD